MNAYKICEKDGLGNGTTLPFVSCQGILQIFDIVQPRSRYRRLNDPAGAETEMRVRWWTSLHGHTVRKLRFYQHLGRRLRNEVIGLVSAHAI